MSQTIWISLTSIMVMALVLFSVLQQFSSLSPKAATATVMLSIGIPVQLGNISILVYCLMNQTYYLPYPWFILCGCYLGLILFESYSFIMSGIKVHITIWIHHLIFFSMMLIISYDLVAHFVFLLISLTSINVIFYEMKIALPESNKYQKFLTSAHNITFVLLRLIGMPWLIVYYFIHLSQFSNSSDIDLRIYFPILMILNQAINYYWSVAVIKKIFKPREISS